MIGFLSGVIKSVSPRRILLLVGGVGYVVEMCATDLARAHAGKSAEVFCYTHVREDALQIFGFFSVETRDFFEVLLGTSGVGPKSALQILSAGSVNDLRAAIDRADTAFLTAVSGVGKKTAERIIVDLRGKISDILTGATAGSPEAEAIDALCSLGYKADTARLAIRGCTGGTAEIVKQALQNLRRG